MKVRMDKLLIMIESSRKILDLVSAFHEQAGLLIKVQLPGTVFLVLGENPNPRLSKL